MSDNVRELSNAQVLLAPRTPVYVRGADSRMVSKSTVALLYEHVGTAVRTLEDIMLHSEFDSERLRAAAVVLQLTKDYKPDDDTDVQALSDAELLARVKAVCADIDQGAQK